MPNDGYLPLVAGAELVRRSGGLTTFPVGNLLGTLPNNGPPSAARAYQWEEGSRDILIVFSDPYEFNSSGGGAFSSPQAPTGFYNFMQRESPWCLRITAIGDIEPGITLNYNGETCSVWSEANEACVLSFSLVVQAPQSFPTCTP